MRSYYYSFLYLGVVWDLLLHSDPELEATCARKVIVEDGNPSAALAKALYYDQLRFPADCATCSEELAAVRRDTWMESRLATSRLVDELAKGASGLPAQTAQQQQQQLPDFVKVVQASILAKWEKSAKKAVAVVKLSRDAPARAPLNLDAILRLSVEDWRQVIGNLGPVILTKRTCTVRPVTPGEQAWPSHQVLTTARVIVEKFTKAA